MRKIYRDIMKSLDTALYRVAEYWENSSELKKIALVGGTLVGVSAFGATLGSIDASNVKTFYMSPSDYEIMRHQVEQACQVGKDYCLKFVGNLPFVNVFEKITIDGVDYYKAYENSPKLSIARGFGFGIASAAFAILGLERILARFEKFFRQ